MAFSITEHTLKTARHTTGYLACGAQAAALGFCCIAPDMLELLASLGRERAVWVGHDWGSPVVWNIASHHPEKTAGVASLCVPYIAAGSAAAPAPTCRATAT